KALSLTYVVISSDPAVVHYLTAATAVLFAGRIIEVAPTARLFERPLHPYTVSLLALRDPAMALRDDGLSGARSPQAAPQGCRFAGICPLELPQCREQPPDLTGLGGGRGVSCHRRAADREVLAASEAAG